MILLPWVSRGEGMIQYFNTSYRELTRKMPELAEIGYRSVWLPPPTKGSGGLSVGYDLWDRFDLGSKDQRGSVSTRYGTEAELLRLIETAHRFGIRIYFDNVMNHNAFDIPGFDAGTPIDIYPGMVPEDLHLRVTAEGFYRKWDNTRDWGSAWQVQNLGLADLVDIAHETPNTNFGPNEGDDHPKISFVRHPENPEYYLDFDLPLPFTNPAGTYDAFTFANKEPFDDTGWGVSHTGAGNGRFDWDDTNGNGQHDAGEAAEPFDDTGLEPDRPGWDDAAHGFGNGRYDMGNPIAEDVNGMLIRAVRWLMDRTRADGLRLDAVKHVPDYFFGAQSGGGKDYSSDGYLGQAQEQFNLTRGFSDWDHHRDTVFSTEAARDDAMMFGEHLGQPPGFGGYIDAGMRLVDNDLRGRLNGDLGNPFAGLFGLDQPGGGGFAPGVSVMHAQSHDNDYASARELQHAFYFTREGIPLIYTDGNHQAETLGESGGAFPRHANTAFLGQFGDSRIPNAVYLHEHFARGFQAGRWADGDVVAYDRIDKRENGAMSDDDGTIMCFMMNDNFADGQYREIDTTFAGGSWLWQYASGGAAFYYQVPGDGKIKVIVPPGGYFAFSWRSPEASDLWAQSGGNTITLWENGEPTGFVSYEREDGPDGDPRFNPQGVPDADITDFKYTWFVPRLTSPTNVDVRVFVDGTAENVLLNLDGGVDINSHLGQGPQTGDLRDNAPALATDVFLGYEQMQFVHRQYREKFAARNTETNNVIGSIDAENFGFTVGSAGFSIVAGSGEDSDQDTASFVYHDPEAVVTGGGLGNPLQFNPAPAGASGSTIDIWAKVGFRNDINKGRLYYTTDGANPEGAGGFGRDTTRVVEMFFQHNETNGMDVVDWWKGTLPAQTHGVAVKYKVGFYRDGVPSRFPNDVSTLDHKKSMLTAFEVTGLNPGSMAYRPHRDYGGVSTGLVEGFHMLKARAFLDRPGRAAIYNTIPQTFYYDAETPGGELVFPAENDALGGRTYGAVVRTDYTVSRVLYHIDDSDPANDDSATGIANGNGMDTNGTADAWVDAVQVNPTAAVDSTYPEEFRFSINNIPAGGSNAVIKVRLLEVSSSTNTALNAADAHVTEIVRNVTTDADPNDIFIAFPGRDGETIGHPYTMKVYYGAGLPDAGFDNWVFSINGNVQGRDGWGVNANVTPNLHELAVPLPVLWNGIDDFVHELKMTHTTLGNVTRQSIRFVKVFPVDLGPFLAINTPPEFDSDGRRFVIELPDVPAPTPEQRRYTIQVESDTSVRNAWIAFDGQAATARLARAVLNPVAGTVDVVNGSPVISGNAVVLTGTATATTNSATIAGNGTLFSSEVREGRSITIAGNTLIVTQVVSDTELGVQIPYPATSVTGAPVELLPSFDTELSPGSIVQLAGTRYTIQTVVSSSNATLSLDYAGATAAGLVLSRVDTNPFQQAGRLLWDFDWTNMLEGTFRFTAYADTNGDTNTVEASVSRNTEVRFIDEVAEDPDDLDDDDDGLFDGPESTPVELPETNPETWNNGDVHVWRVYGRSNPLRPDSDADGLTDGLEAGWRVADTNETDITQDSNGDGIPNFLPDLDPPLFNTVPDNSCLPDYVFLALRTDQIHGSRTDPGNPDTDLDGIIDGVEDANHNGWVDGDGTPLAPTADPCAHGPFANGIMEAGETWTETDPNNPDSDGDDANDGVEDLDKNGRIAGDANNNRVYDTGEAWTETDPLSPDTDGDGLPDGWENNFLLDPLIGDGDNLGTAGPADGDAEFGATGNPDGDTIVIMGVTNDYTNLLEFQNGTNPRIPDTGDPLPPGAIVIGPGPVLGETGIGTNFQEFTDWSRDDLLALDEYEGDGPNNRQGDLYLGYDGFDSSRDIVAFYARDGGDIGAGGDGNFYFRLDFHDLQAFAEDANLDFYVVIDTGSPAFGERLLPDDVDTLTDMKWEAVVACYQGNVGTVYVDENVNQNTTALGEDLFGFGGVAARGQDSGFGFREAYFNSELDAVELSISRQALLDAGWNGLSRNSLNFQVFTTRDGTCNGCNGGGPGLGDIGGRSDVRDAVFNDFIAEDQFQAQQGLQSILFSWIPGSFGAGRAKVAIALHANQALQPGSVVQDLINNGSGGGYYRALDAHEVFQRPLNLHVTPTLASAIEWAAVDPAWGTPWRDGPAFNDRIRDLASSNLVQLMASTFSDHIMPYFTTAYNNDNIAQAGAFLTGLYGVAPNGGTTPFWTPERVVDADVLGKIQAAGYHHTVVDQMLHMRRWFGRETALGDDGFRINRIHGVNCFVINDFAGRFLFETDDRGLNLELRNLVSRKARSGTQDQVITLMKNWETFRNPDNALAYDYVIRWIANRPWVALVGLEDIAAGEVDITGDGNGDTWSVRDRGSPPLDKIARDFIHHASEEDYDNWYLGAGGLEEGLLNKVFDIRPGVPMPDSYGMQFTGGVVSDAWDRVSAIADTDLKALAGAVYHASTFETAFHNNSNNDLSKFSTGDYVNPDTDFNTLAEFSRESQAQTRKAAMYKRVDEWVSGVATQTLTLTRAEDIDLDGETEYLLYNQRLFCVFETIGGRLIAAWVRSGPGVYQVVGNLVSYAGFETEEEDAVNVITGATARISYRTSCLKDWWDGSAAHVNGLYTFTPAANGWQIQDGDIIRIVTLSPNESRLEVTYLLTGSLSGATLFVRNGLSPNLYDLLTAGQANLGALSDDGQTVSLVNTNGPVSAAVGYADGTHNASYVAGAVDDDPVKGVEFYTLNMRNQAQTHQVEISGTGAFSFSLEFSAGGPDFDNDGLPDDSDPDDDNDGMTDVWELLYGLNPFSAADAAQNGDSDPFNNLQEFIANTVPTDGLDFLAVTNQSLAITNVVVEWTSKTNRVYYISFTDAIMLLNGAWQRATPSNAPIAGIAGPTQWIDDGSETGTPPTDPAATRRNYRVEVELP